MVYVPNLVSALKGHLYLSGAWLDANLRLDTKRTYFEKDWTMLWNFVDHSRCCSQYNNRGRPIWFDLMRKRTFTFTMNRIFKWPPNIMRRVATGTIWICIWISHWLCVSYPMRSWCREKSDRLRPTYLGAWILEWLFSYEPGGAAASQ